MYTQKRNKLYRVMIGQRSFNHPLTSVLGTYRPLTLVGGTIHSNLVIVSWCFCGLIWRSGVRTHCKAFVPHLGLFSIQGSLLGYSCDIVQGVQLSELNVNKFFMYIIDGLDLPLGAFCLLTHIHGSSYHLHTCSSHLRIHQAPELPARAFVVP